MTTDLPVLNPCISFWRQTTRSYSYLIHNDEGPIPKAAKYVIIGSGISGALAAFKLVEGGIIGADIVILEAREAASGASSRNAGHIRPDCFRGFTVYKSFHGEEHAAKSPPTREPELSSPHIEFYPSEEARQKTSISQALCAYEWPAGSGHPAKLAQWLLVECLSSLITPERAQAHAFVPPATITGSKILTGTISLRRGLRWFYSINQRRSDGVIILGSASASPKISQAATTLYVPRGRTPAAGSYRETRTGRGRCDRAHLHIVIAAMPPSTNMAPETPPGRGISSRLLTMKFMQRAAASDSAPEPSPEEPSSKRRKFQNSPLSGDFHSFDQTAVQAALKQQEAKRLSALEASRAELADTHWVLDGSWGKSTETENAPPNIVYVGYADIDVADGEEEATATAQVGRMKIGSNKKKVIKNAKETPKKTKNESSDSDGSSESADDSSDDSADDDDDDDEASSSSDEEVSMKTPPKAVKGLASGGQGRTRVNLQAKKSSESMKAKEFREKRKKKEVKLNQLASISGGATGGFSGAGKPSAPFNCHNCSKPGHKAAECPQRRGGGKRKSFDKSR
ncbi:hypothetical protein CORC01_11941 [Colletotrichum orchidophilum]|uniref:CCHC-type domain-containing protein n=1 Tax=Colletotrichum orchidophilum TaxID=1209926 RepID=A0A1G4AUK7_9PEZI|nr:uncharacterized protein CORC01_11941 [Colletotrichum orchidophilum]OHE92791.1 hypothetical protein CORC01_11941 [Colletotrichum orchidophilum]